jgi:hypothetical protein
MHTVVGSERLKAVLREKPLYVQLEEEYEAHHETTLLEQKKKELERKRQLRNQRCDLDSLADHQRKYE